MTVKDLIEELQSYPQDMIVVTDSGILNKNNLGIVMDYYNGDAANPNCEILTEVLYIE